MIRLVRFVDVCSAASMHSDIPSGKHTHNYGKWKVTPSLMGLLLIVLVDHSLIPYEAQVCTYIYIYTMWGPLDS